MYQANASEEEIRSGKDVTFREFVLDILDHQSNAPNNVTTKQNEHWNAQFFIAGLCHPWVKFDLIARYKKSLCQFTPNKFVKFCQL